jgi:hypothetical protein
MEPTSSRTWYARDREGDRVNSLVLAKNRSLFGVWRNEGVQGEQLVSAKEGFLCGISMYEEGCLRCGSIEPTWHSGHMEGYSLNSLFQQRRVPCVGFQCMRKDV